MGKRFHYTYRVKFPSQGWYYYGLHSTDDLNDGYSGSPVTHKDKWDLFAWEMEILEFHESREDAIEVEKRILRHVFQLPECLNEHCGGNLSTDACKKGGTTTAMRHDLKPRLKRGREKRWKNATEGDLRKQGDLMRVAQKEATRIQSHPCVLTHKPTGDEFYFSSIRAAGRAFNIPCPNLLGVLRGERKQAQGYTIRYL